MYEHLGGVSQPPVRRAAAKAMVRISDITAVLANSPIKGRGAGRTINAAGIAFGSTTSRLNPARSTTPPDTIARRSIDVSSAEDGAAVGRSAGVHTAEGEDVVANKRRSSPSASPRLSIGEDSYSTRGVSPMFWRR